MKIVFMQVWHSADFEAQKHNDHLSSPARQSANSGWHLSVRPHRGNRTEPYSDSRQTCTRSLECMCYHMWGKSVGEKSVMDDIWRERESE